MMKRHLIPAFCAVVVAGCATSNFSFGRDFPTDNVGKLVKGKTTLAEVRQLFGEPFSKSPLSDTEERWLYTYTSGSAHATSLLVTTNVQTKSRQKTLDLLLREGVVINYTFSEGPGPSSVH